MRNPLLRVNGSDRDMSISSNGKEIKMKNDNNFIEGLKITLLIALVAYATLAGMGLLPPELDFLNLYG